MAEIARFEALATSRAKSDFISSISHELRSPLHGILASAELLRDTLTLSPRSSTVDMIDMIESCGNTLLDTLTNLLDFTKINSLVQSQPHKDNTVGHNNEPKGACVDTSLSVDLSLLVEVKFSIENHTFCAHLVMFTGQDSLKTLKMALDELLECM